MNQAYEGILQSALTLPEEQRVQLVDALIATLPTEQGGELSEEWMAEIDRRSNEYDAGKAELFTWEQVKQAAQERLGKAMTVAYLAGAKTDFAEAVEYYDERSESARDRFELAVEHAVEAILAAQIDGRESAELTGGISFSEFPFSIIYRVEPELIVIVAVAHASRKPGYWKRRK